VLTETEFWQLRGLIDALGEPEVAVLCKCTVAQLDAAIWPGADAGSVARVREVLRGRLRRRPTPEQILARHFEDE
jgi:hypothetical protein